MFAISLKNWRKRWFSLKEAEKDDFLEENAKNHYLPQLRDIIENILKQREIAYEDFAPIIIDGENTENSLAAVRLLSRDLNYLSILTNHSEYFEDISERLYEEYGLLVEILPKTLTKIAALPLEETKGNVILDFEEQKERICDIKFGKKIYLPIFKRKWASSGNLDIAVPIGYNTVIVRNNGTEYKQSCLDKFEQAFYENE